MTKFETAYIGLGGNVGDVQQSISLALQALENGDATRVEKVSKLYKSPPWGIEDQDWFLNCCTAIATRLEPTQLLDHCLEIEQQLKRERLVRWGPRTIDLDILIYGERTIREEGLVIPHPRMCERQFVLQPLAEIAPELVIQGRPIFEILTGFDEPLMALDLPNDWWKIP